eukprot:symbB.v1.2.014933.t4/scaffold1103.1/size137753/9
MSVSTRTDTTLSKDAGEEVKLRMHETIQKAGADGNSVLRGLVLAQKGRSHCVPSGEEMKFRSALLLYSCLAWTQAEEPESRFGLVISTLEEIGKNIDKESARETASFTKFQAWCSDEIEGLSSGSEKSKDSSEKAFVQLRELTASISVLESGIANLQGDVKELQDAQDQISNIREEEASKYNEEVDLNTESARTVDKALSKIGAKSSFLQRQQSLEPDSGYVLGLLRGIKERLNQTRSELDQTEEAKKKTHSTLFKAKKDQLAVLQAEVLEKTRLLQQNKVQLVEAQRIHDQEKESSKEMISMQAETKKKCAEKADEYKTRQEDKKNEKAAITEAVTLLKQEEAGAKNAAGAVFFLQTSSGHKSGQMSEDKKDLVRNAVWLMQQQTADKVKGMGKAAEAVLGLVEAIRGHQAEDTKRKQFCEFQMDGSQDTKAKLEGDVARLKVSTDITTEPAAKRGKASPSHIEVSVSLGLAGRTVSLSVPRQIQVSDLRAQIALASPDFEHEMSLILGDREVEDTEQLSELQVAQTLDTETTWCGLEFTAVRDDGRRIRQKLKQKVREFDHYDLDRLCREGDPELQEELWGSDMEALYRKNDELIDQLGIADLRDMEAHYRLVQRHGMRITCKSCCSSLGPGCLIWDLTGHLRVIGPTSMPASRNWKLAKITYARQDYLTSEVSSLTTEVEALKKDAAKFTDRLSQLEEVRGKEQDSYKASTRDRGLTLKVVKKAKSIVEGFYKSKDPTSFSQEEASPPKVPWKLGSSRNGNLGSSVIAMLDTIVDDFGKEQQDADKAEEKAEKELAQVRSETKSLFDKKLDHVSKLLQEKARDAQELSQVKADAELKTSSLAATEDALAKLGKDCTKLLADYEKVSEERQKQIWQLQDVADILSGAKASGTLEPAPHNPTMRALLERYTQSHTLTERDEDGEHPLFPQSRSRGRAEQRPGHAAGGAELVLAKESIASSREQILISRVLHKIDTEKLTHVKDAFMEKDNALTSKDFVDLLLPTVRSMEGGEEQVVAALQLVHEMIGQGVKGEDESEKESEVKETAQEDELMNPAFMTEAQVEEETQKLVSWEVFAKLLLQEGVVANVVSGFNLAQVLSVIDLEKITPLQAIFEKKGNVDLESFVVIMKGQFQQVFELIALFELYEDERKIITQLVNLFDAIDVDCNGSMTWEEFTAFLVDQGMAEDVPQQYNIIRFSQSPLKDGNGHQSHCEKVIYLKGYDKVAFVEQGSKCLKLCSPDMKPYFEIRDFTQTPLCAEYIENPVQRRHGFLSIVVALRPCEAKAEEPFNPLKLKGYFWETGKFYEGETSETNIAEILEELKETASLLQPFESLVSEGKFEELKTKLRGANFSESLLRIRGKRVLKLLSQQESTVEDDEKFREAEQAYVLLGKELNGLNGAIDSATVDFSRGALQLVASKKVVLAALETSGGIWRCPSPTPSRYNWVAVSCSDKYLSFFDADNSLKLVRRVQSKTAQRVLCWSEAAEVLFSGDHEGRILSWSLHKVKFGPFDDKTGEEKKEPTWRDFMKAGPLS